MKKLLLLKNFTQFFYFEIFWNSTLIILSLLSSNPLLSYRLITIHSPHMRIHHRPYLPFTCSPYAMIYHFPSLYMGLPPFAYNPHVRVGCPISLCMGQPFFACNPCVRVSCHLLPCTRLSPLLQLLWEGQLLPSIMSRIIPHRLRVSIIVVSCWVLMRATMKVVLDGLG